MRVHPARSRRWLLLATPLVLLTLFLLAGLGARATGARGGRDATDSAVYLAYVSVPPAPPLLDMVEFARLPEAKTIMAISHAPNDPRLFVAHREGKIWVIQPDGTVLQEPFLDISGQVAFQDNFEQGLLGLAFHPDYPRTPYFYVSFTGDKDIYIARGQVDPANPNKALAAVNTFITIRKSPIYNSEGTFQGWSPVHNAGDLKFGPDGYLYIPVGDGGPDPYGELPPGVPGDPENNSQRHDVLLGSILRIDPDPNRGLPADCRSAAGYYSIPPDNPWLDTGGPDDRYNCGEIWALGVRNPWRISFDRLTGEMFFGDVGEALWEEINYLPANAPGGANFGWHCWEGMTDYTTLHPGLAGRCANTSGRLVFPVHQYNHKQGECSVIGGYVYRGSRYPDLYGRYLFADWCTGYAWTMARVDGKWQVSPATDGPSIRFTTFGEDINGELYAGVYLDGVVYKIVARTASAR